MNEDKLFVVTLERKQTRVVRVLARDAWHAKMQAQRQTGDDYRIERVSLDSTWIGAVDPCL